MATTVNLPVSITQPAESLNTGERGGLAGAHEVPSGIASAARIWTNDVGGTASNNSDLRDGGSQWTVAKENALFGGSNGFSFANGGDDIYAKNNPASTQPEVSSVSNAATEVQNSTVAAARSDTPYISAPQRARSDTPDMSAPQSARSERPDMSAPQLERSDNPNMSAPQSARSERPEIATPTAQESPRSEAREASPAPAAQGDGWVQIPTVPMWLVMGDMSPLSGCDTNQAFQQLTNTQYYAFLQDNPQCRPDVQNPQRDSEVQALMGDEAYLHDQDAQTDLPPDAFGT
jgi:hypothetical protein